MYSFVIVWWGAQNGTQVAVCGTVTDRSLRDFVGKCTFTGGVEPRPYAESLDMRICGNCTRIPFTERSRTVPYAKSLENARSWAE